MRVLESLCRFKARAHIKKLKECFLNRSPLYTHVSKNVISVSEISAVNFIVGWKLFACSMKLFIASLFMFHREKMLSCLFPNEWFVRTLVDDISSAINMFAKETAIFVPIAVPCVIRSYQLSLLYL